MRADGDEFFKEAHLNAFPRPQLFPGSARNSGGVLMQQGLFFSLNQINVYLSSVSVCLGTTLDNLYLCC